jgi:hypothetical protein
MFFEQKPATRNILHHIEISESCLRRPGFLKNFQKRQHAILKTGTGMDKLLLSVRVGPHVPAHSTPHLAAHPGEAFLFAQLGFAPPPLHVRPLRSAACVFPVDPQRAPILRRIVLILSRWVLLRPDDNRRPRPTD